MSETLDSAGSEVDDDAHGDRLCFASSAVPVVVVP
jgi:hypothetical protein